MSQYLVLSKIQIQNANSIAGLTWGFPAITQFLGFTHALNRKISNKYNGEYETELTGCGVISHAIQNKVYQPNQKYADFEFIQSKNPPVLAKHKNASPPIIEEGKMNLTISLVIELDKSLTLTTDQIKGFEQKIEALCYRMRVAGGVVLSINNVKLLAASTQKQHIELQRKIKRLTMPGFVLLDRNEYLQQHYQTLLKAHEEGGNNEKPQLIDAWLDFSALKFKAISELTKDQSKPDDNTDAKWEYIDKPNAGYLIPLMTGYKAISELYAAQQVKNTRDDITPTRFVEAIHSIGEWKSMHNIQNTTDIIWRYQQDGQWYLCTQNTNAISNESSNTENNEIEQTQTLNLNEALNLF